MYKERSGWNKQIWTNSNRGLPVGFLIAQNSPWYGTRNVASEKREGDDVTSRSVQWFMRRWRKRIVSDWLQISRLNCGFEARATWWVMRSDLPCDLVVSYMRMESTFAFLLFFQGWKQRTRSQWEVQRCKIRARVPRMKWRAWEGFLRVTNNAYGDGSGQSENTLYNITWHM